MPEDVRTPIYRNKDNKSSVIQQHNNHRQRVLFISESCGADGPADPCLIGQMKSVCVRGQPLNGFDDTVFSINKVKRNVHPTQ